MRESGLGRVTVELRIQRRVVVHLELKIHGERAPPGGDVGEEFTEAMAEISTLHPDAGKLLAAFLAMLRRRVSADGFLLHVKFLQCQDRKTVNHHARRLRVSRTTIDRRLQRRDDGLVHFLDEIVSFLIVAIDVALGAVDGLEAEIIPAGDIFLMPQLEVPQMVFLHQPQPAGGRDGRRDFMPAGGENSLQRGDLGSGKTHGRLVGREIELNDSRADTSLRIPRMKSLLVIKPSSLGDIVHGLQVVQTVARARPDLRITWVVRERFADLVKAAPFVAETIIFRRRDGWPAFLKLLRELRRREFDLVWDLQGLLRSGLMTAAVRSGEKLGRPDAREGAGFFYSRRIRRPAGPGPHHALEILLPFLDTVEVRPELSFPLALKPDETFPWRSFFAGDPRSTFVIFTDSRGAAKKWPHFDGLMQTILATIPDSRIAWCAAKRAEATFSAPSGRFLNVTGCALDQMIALVRQPAVFVGNDSGPMHLSAASGNRVLAIFGPTSPRRFGPYPLESPRHESVTAPAGRLDQLGPAAVLEALNRLRSRE